MIKIIKNTISVILLSTFIVSAQSLTKFSGLAYFDYFYNISNKNSSSKDLQGFQFRRIFFTADFDISNKLSARFRLASEGQNQFDLTRFYPYLKDVYFLYKFSDANLYAGLLPTPPIEIEEKYWGYRSVEKIQSDLRGMVSTRDIGAALRGKLNDGKLSYWIMVGNNSSHGVETDKYKRFYLQLNNQFSNNFSASFDFNFANAYQNKHYFYSRVGIYHNNEAFSGGITFSGGLKRKSFDNDDLKEGGVSFFGNYAISSTSKILGRIDYYDPNFDMNKNSEVTFITGFDFKLDKNLSIIPNLIFNYYENKDFKNDLTARLTFYYQF